MVTNRMELWNKYHRKRLRDRLLPFIFGKKWITDSGLSLTEEVLHTCLDIYRREEKSVDPKKYREKLFSIADNLSKEAEKASGTEEAAKEAIKKYIADLPYQRYQYNLIDIFDAEDEESEEPEKLSPIKKLTRLFQSKKDEERKRILKLVRWWGGKGANCLGKTTLFACLAEMVDHNLFSKLRKVNIPSHTFIRIKDANGDRDIETTAPYSEMEGNSIGIGVECDIKMCAIDILSSHYENNLYEEEILNKILNINIY